MLINNLFTKFFLIRIAPISTSYWLTTTATHTEEVGELQESILKQDQQDLPCLMPSGSQTQCQVKLQSSGRQHLLVEKREKLRKKMISLTLILELL